MLKIETMTTNELIREMRALGISVSNEALTLGIEQGIYPFAVSTKPEPGVHRHIEIYRRLFDEWVRERAVDDGGVA